MKYIYKQRFSFVIGLLNVFYCLTVATTILYFEKYFGRDLIFYSVLLLGVLLFVDVNVIIKARAKYAINQFLSLLSAIGAIIVLYFANIHNILGNFTFNYGFKSVGVIVLNFDAFGIAIYTGLGVIALLFACLFVFAKERI